MSNERQSLVRALQNAVNLYRDLPNSLFASTVIKHHDTEQKVMAFFERLAKAHEQ